MEFLSQKNIEFEEVNIREDPGAAQRLAELGSMSTPTIVIGDQVIIGFDPAKIEAAIAA